MARKILVVDDEESVRQGISLMIECMGFQVQAAPCGEKAVNIFKEETFDLVLSDFHMPGMDGVALARAIKEISPRTPVILVTGDHKEITGKRPGRNSVDTAVPKPVMLNQLKETIARVLG
jgi:CheY-like chemotaxis protein